MLRRVRLAALVGACLAAVPLASAQSWTVALGAGAPAGTGAPAPRARVALHDLRLGDDTFELGVGWTDGGPAAAAGWRRTMAAGPLGTLVVEASAGYAAGGTGYAAGGAGHAGGGAGAAAGGGNLAAAVRGTVGPVALRLEVAGGTRPPAPWPVAARGAAPAAPTVDLAPLTGATGARLDLGAHAVWRVDRLWTVELTPRALRAAGGWAGAASASLRRGDVAPDVDLSARLDLAFGPLAHHVATGLTLHHVPRRAPESRLTAWWGGDATARGPGLELAWVVRGDGAQATFTGAIGPDWSDRPDAYLAVALQRPWGSGTVHVAGRWVAPGSTALELAWVWAGDR